MRIRPWLRSIPLALITFVIFSEDRTNHFKLEAQTPPFNAQGGPNRNRPGPWDNDVLVYRAGKGGTVEKLAVFERAGVPTVARMKDGRLIAAHQHFPENDDAGFDKVATRFSSDEGKTWTVPRVIHLDGLPKGMRFPFDPTLVPLPDGQVRLYFTSLKGGRIEGNRPAIYSAISTNGLDYTVEPGVRFSIADRPVIDCAVALHRGVFHLYAPDNGAGGAPGEERQAGDRPQAGTGYHATSPDGLQFTRQADVRIGGQRRWLGNAQSDGKQLTFFGTGDGGGPGRGRGGVWLGSSTDGQVWELASDSPAVPGADPGGVMLRDGGYLILVTGPPRGKISAHAPP